MANKLNERANRDSENWVKFFGFNFMIGNSIETGLLNGISESNAGQRAKRQDIRLTLTTLISCKCMNNSYRKRRWETIKFFSFEPRLSWIS
jgi:hypothetical protein